MAGAQQDWRDGAAYAALLHAERSIFAWEWLRRDTAYRAGFQAGKCAARQWGLLQYEDPDLPAPLARPFWAKEAEPYTLCAAASPCDPGPDAFDPALLPGLVSSIQGGENRHLLISNGLRTIRLDLVGKCLGAGPIRLRFMVEGLGSAGPSLLSLRQLIALCRRGRFEGPLFRPETRARRWILELRAFDALSAGAAQRDVAALLFGMPAELCRWRIEAPSVRLQVQRLVRRARMLGRGGYLAFLKLPRSMKMD
jgi:hypothetical protein